jgi:hypothetical protein
MSMDPDYTGHPLLEQYQAQIVSILRPAFNLKEASPFVTSAASSVIADYIIRYGYISSYDIVMITFSTVIRDPKVLVKVLSLLTTPLQDLHGSNIYQ